MQGLARVAVHDGDAFSSHHALRPKHFLYPLTRSHARKLVSSPFTALPSLMLHFASLNLTSFTSSPPPLSLLQLRPSLSHFTSNSPSPFTFPFHLNFAVFTHFWFSFLFFASFTLYFSASTSSFHRFFYVSAASFSRFLHSPFSS